MRLGRIISVGTLAAGAFQAYRHYKGNQDATKGSARGRQQAGRSSFLRNRSR
jgi:hypothetical protein